MYQKRDDIRDELTFLKKMAYTFPEESLKRREEIQRACDYIEMVSENTSNTTTFHSGDILDSGADIIVHQVNCMGVMGAGMAKQIRNKYPNVFDIYKKRCDEFSDRLDRLSLLGKAQYVQISRNRYIANCFGQLDYRRRGQYDRMTDYDALKNALKSVNEFAIIRQLKTVAIPFWLGCGLAGGDWNTVKNIIDAELADSVFELQIWKK